MVIQHIAIFRALNLGDMLCATPALRALRHAFPQADIALIGLPWAQAFQHRYAGWLDRFFAFPGYPGLPEARGSAEERAAFFRTMQDAHFDLALQMHGSGPTSNEVVGRFGARRTLGLGSGEDRDGLQLWPYPEHSHEIQRNLLLLDRGLGIQTQDADMEFPVTSGDWEELACRPELIRCQERPYVCLQTGASTPDKRWPPGHFAIVGDALAERGLQVVLTGSGKEHELAAGVAARMRHPAVNAACDISIGAMAALLSGARLLITNDTGVAHLGTALRVPSVVIFFATDSRRWGPPANERHRLVQGMYPPHPTEVMQAAVSLLADTTSRPGSQAVSSAHSS